MNHEIPFDSIESAHEFVDLLAQVVLETRHDIEGDIQAEAGTGFSRRLEALQVTAYKMQTLEFHLKKSKRILNDLRTLRRLLIGKAPETSAVRPKITVAKPKLSPVAARSAAKNGRPEEDLALLGLTG